MESSLLLVLLLLGVLSSVSTDPESEPCHIWDFDITDGATPTPVGVFQCPELLGSADAKFCCGTCGAPYCCSSEEARLDPVQCALAASQEGETAAPMPTPAPPLVGPKEGVRLDAVFGFVALVVVLVTGYCLCCHAEVFMWLKDRCCSESSHEEAELVELDDLHHPTRLRLRALARMWSLKSTPQQ